MGEIDKLYRLNDVRRIVRLSRTEIYRRIARGQFPAGVRLGVRSRAWRESELRTYLDGLASAKGERAA